jgi:hypothetical protein
MLFTSVAEWLFWDEFGVRFNFAVDYLVYSDEVLNNLLESYPIGKLAVLAVALSFALRKPFNAALNAPLPPLRTRLANALGLLIVAGLSAQLLDQDARVPRVATPIKTNWRATARISSSPRTGLPHSSTPPALCRCRATDSRRVERTRRPLHR